MKKLLITTACALAFASWNVLAVEEHHPGQAQSAKAPAPDTGKTVQKMQDNVKKMQGQLDRIAKTKDAKERQKLLQEYMHTLQDNMMASKGMMAGMMDCPMMKDGMMGGGMGMMGSPGGSADTPQDAAMNRMQMMEKRMDMMQMMMENMSKGQGQAMPAK